MKSTKDTLINSSSIDKLKEVKKDSAVSWLICFISWLTQVVILGVLHGFGVFFVEFVIDFGSTKSKAVIMNKSESSAESSAISDSNILIQKSSTEEEIKDTFHSWVVCFCGFVARVLVLGILHGFGSFFIEIIKEFNVSKECSAWVGSLAYGLSMTFGPLASMLVNRFDNRVVMVLGGTMASLSILASSFVKSIEMLFVTFSVFYGIGTCFCITPIMTIATQYFDKYLTIAVGIITAGSSFGTLIYAPMSQALIDSIGWRNTFRVYAGLCSISAICSLFIKPISNKKKTDEEKLQQSPLRRLIQDLRLWQNRVFVVWTISITLVMFGFYIPYVHLVAYAEDCGLTPEQGSIFVMMLGACTAVGRIFFGKVVQYGFLNRLAMHQFSMVVTGVGVMFLPLLKTFGGITFYVIWVGLVDGCYVVLLPVLTATLVGVENTVLAWGFLVGTSSITFTAGPPLAGAIYDMMGSYDLAFHLAGLPIILGALTLFLIPWAQRTSKTNNVMIVISEYDMADDSDFADDIFRVTRDAPYRESASSATLTDDPRHHQRRVRGRRFKTKRYLDQETSTSPGSIHVPVDINEALVMFHENAKMIATMLDNTAGQGVGQFPNKNSEKSRSEMVQNLPFLTSGPTPHGVISIMSVPGGIAVGTFGGNLTQTTPSESVSSNIFSNQRRATPQPSETSSIRSKAYDVTSEYCSPSQGRFFQVFQPTQQPSVVTESTQTASVSKEETTTGVQFEVAPAQPVKQQTQDSEGSHLSFENNYVTRPVVVSPCYLSPNKLQTIPEIIPLPEPPKNSPRVATGTNSSVDTSTVFSSSSVSQDAKEGSDTQQAQDELDVFTHLFTDDNENV